MKITVFKVSKIEDIVNNYQGSVADLEFENLDQTDTSRACCTSENTAVIGQSSAQTYRTQLKYALIWSGAGEFQLALQGLPIDKAYKVMTDSDYFALNQDGLLVFALAESKDDFSRLVIYPKGTHFIPELDTDLEKIAFALDKYVMPVTYIQMK